MQHLEIFEYSGIFILNSEYQILFQNNLLCMKMNITFHLRIFFI